MIQLSQGGNTTYRVVSFACLVLSAVICAALLTSAPQVAYAEDEDDLVAGTLEYIVRNGNSQDSQDSQVSGAVSKVVWNTVNDVMLGGASASNAVVEKEFVPYTIDSNGVRSYAVFPFLPNPTTDAFIESIGESAREIGQKEGLYASVMIAQAILESGSGSSGLSKPPYNNLFGIKGSYKGATVVLMTQEDDGAGNLYDIADGFRRYPSIKESLEDYADLLKRSMGDFYAPVWKVNARTYVEACNYLQGRYATDTTYSGQLQGIILAYNLVDYDHPKEWAKSKAGRKAKAKSQLMAMTYGGKAMKPLVLEHASSGVYKQEDTSAEPAPSETPAPSTEAADLQMRFAKPLSDPAVQISVLSCGALVVVLARNELVMLLAAIKGFLAGLPFLGH